MGWECGTFWERQDSYKIMVGKPEGKRSLGRLKCRQEDNIKTDFQEVGWKSVDWIDVAQKCEKLWAVFNKVMNLCVVLNAGNFFEKLRHYQMPKM